LPAMTAGIESMQPVDWDIPAGEAEVAPGRPIADVARSGRLGCIALELAKVDVSRP